MAIRTKAYRSKAGGNREVRAVRISEKNWEELAAYIDRNGGIANASAYVTKDGDLLNHTIRVYQQNPNTKWKGRGWRVARVGDWIVKNEEGEFSRVKDDVFEAEYALVK